MKLLIVVSSLDLKQPFSATPAWWQLMKGLYEIGVDVIATPYQGPTIETLWWRAERNPARWQGDVFKTARDLMRKFGGEEPQVQIDDTAALQRSATGSIDEMPESLSDKLIRKTAQTFIPPVRHRQLDRLLTQQPDIDAIIVFTVPLNHLVGVMGDLRAKHNIPIFYFDGDVPASLPIMKGFASGFRIYHGVDVNEYTAFLSNSKGGEDLLREFGVANAHTLWYGVDTDTFSPVAVPAQDIDVMFYGHGREYRGEWIDRMVRDASQTMTDSRFAVRGTRLGDLGHAEMLPYLSFSKLREYANRSKINLCITRGSHANFYATATSRPFELASMECCVVGNPYLGVEEWFEPGKEMFIVHSAEEAVDRYRYLLAHDSERRQIGQAARQRVLKQHTVRHRAQELVDIVKSYC